MQQSVSEYHLLNPLPTADTPAASFLLTQLLGLVHANYTMTTIRLVVWPATVRNCKHKVREIDGFHIVMLNQSLTYTHTIL